jgi:uncharacterized Zn finger protein (UPF0148 family)
MADLLRSGNTMLNIACPVCNNPVFRNKNGNTFCPTCDRNVLIVNNKEYPNNLINENKFSDKLQDINHPRNQIKSLTKLKVAIYEKVNEIIQKLKNETHLRDIEAYTRILLNCIKIINQINNQD